MAAKKGKKKKGGLVDPRKRRKAKKPGPLWTLVAVLAIAAALSLFCTVGLTNWRSTDPTAFHYMKDKQKTTQNYEVTNYGLFIVSFNGGISTKTWYTMAQWMCTAIDYLAPLMEGSEAIMDASCDSNCISHFRTRCSTYKIMSTLGYLVMGLVVVVGCAALAGAAWFFIFGKSPLFMTVVWGAGGFGLAAVEAWWVWITDSYWQSLRVQSNFPYPSLDIAFYINFGGACVILSCGLFAGVLSWMDRQAEWKQRQDAIRAKIVKEDPLDPFAPATIPPPMGFPNPMGPGAPPPYRPPLGGAPMGGRPRPPMMNYPPPHMSPGMMR